MREMQQNYGSATVIHIKSFRKMRSPISIAFYSTCLENSPRIGKLGDQNQKAISTLASCINF
jgi:hypothetical protein